MWYLVRITSVRFHNPVSTTLSTLEEPPSLVSIQKLQVRDNVEARHKLRSSRVYILREGWVRGGLGVVKGGLGVGLGWVRGGLGVV